MWHYRQTNGQNIYRIDAHLRWESAQQNGEISQLGAEKSTFPPKPDRQTYIHTDGRTDICFYRVALLLRTKLLYTLLKGK